jgi:hypothetical protein
MNNMYDDASKSISVKITFKGLWIRHRHTLALFQATMKMIHESELKIPTKTFKVTPRGIERINE